MEKEFNKIKISLNKSKIGSNINKFNTNINKIITSIDKKKIYIKYSKISLSNEQSLSMLNIFKYLYNNKLLDNSLNKTSPEKYNEFKQILLTNNFNKLTQWINDNGKHIMRETNNIARMNKIPQNLYNNNIDNDIINEFVEMDILEYLLNKLDYKHNYTINYNNILINLVIFSKNKTINKKVLNNIIIRIIVLGLYKTKSKLTLNIDIFMTHFKKQINKYNNNLGPREINSGFTSPHHKLSIFRSEELNKVLVHELIHYLELDLNHVEFDDISNYYNINPSTEIRLNEAYTEILALIINSIINSNSLPQLKKTLTIELKFSLYQVAKILDFYKFRTSYDFFKPHINDNFKQNTSIFSYFIVKTALLYYLDTFLVLYYSNSLTKSNFKEYIIDIINKKYIDDINKYMLYIQRNKNCHSLYNTLRMTYKN